MKVSINSVTALVAWITLSAVRSDPPAKEPPSSLVDENTLGGSIPLEFFFDDDTAGGNGTHFIFTEEAINQMKSSEITRIKRFESWRENSGLPLQMLAFGPRSLPKVIFSRV